MKVGAGRQLKAVGMFTRMRFQRWTTWSYWPWRNWIPRSSFDYAAEVGDGTGSSTVMAPLNWIARNFPEAPPALWRILEDGQKERIQDHPLLRLLRRPNGYYSGRTLWMATITGWNVDGNAYWLKLRTGTGQIGELWWVPHWLIQPKGDENTFITHYEYRPRGETIKIRREDVVHFRFGLDSANPLLGYSPLKSVLREVFTDDEAANFTASLLRNMGVPGIIVSPRDASRPPSQEEADATKLYLQSMTTGDKRGEPMVMRGPTEIQQFGFSPEQLLLRDLRRIPEERVSAVLGVPAIVAGLGAGLERSTFTNMNEAREMAYESNIIPSQGILSADIELQLLSDYEADPFMWRFGFDLSEVRVLQEDEYRLMQRLDIGYRGGSVRRSEVRRELGLPIEDSDEVYLMPLNVATVPVDGSAPLVVAGSGNGKGNGAVSEDVVAEVLRELDRRAALSP